MKKENPVPKKGNLRIKKNLVVRKSNQEKGCTPKGAAKKKHPQKPGPARYAKTPKGTENGGREAYP